MEYVTHTCLYVAYYKFNAFYTFNGKYCLSRAVFNAFFEAIKTLYLFALSPHMLPDAHRISSLLKKGIAYPETVN